MGYKSTLYMSHYAEDIGQKFILCLQENPTSRQGVKPTNPTLGHGARQEILI